MTFRANVSAEKISRLIFHRRSTWRRLLTQELSVKATSESSTQLTRAPKVLEGRAPPAQCENLPVQSVWRKTTWNYQLSCRQKTKGCRIPFPAGAKRPDRLWKPASYSNSTGTSSSEGKTDGAWSSLLTHFNYSYSLFNNVVNISGIYSIDFALFVSDGLLKS